MTSLSRRGYGRTVNTSRVEPPPAELPAGIRMLADRLLVKYDAESAERRSSSGIVIPATAVVERKLAWGYVAATGQGVRQIAVGDRVLFDPEERAEVELTGTVYVVLRERDVHAVARPEVDGRGTGLYL
ncbi:MAG: GroES family chaperonin [Cellulomonas sp.]